MVVSEPIPCRDLVGNSSITLFSKHVRIAKPSRASDNAIGARTLFEIAQRQERTNHR